ncbi:DUF2511 domain-containing protein [Micromonospora sp. NPDC003816]|uniref:DUF2511 domain-containing protein n=1 Tax=Micromonospora sp. NPDC003816 TaxID=3364224 RepID=UPI0036BF2D4A
MRRNLAAVLAVALLALTACGGADDTDTSSKTITKAAVEAEGKFWPFTTSEATLRCNGQAVTATVDGTKYALNGRAKGSGVGADLDPVWAENPDIPGTKISVHHVIEMGLDLC